MRFSPFALRDGARAVSLAVLHRLMCCRSDRAAARWDGVLLARHLGDISEHQIWRVLRRPQISLARRRSWCVSTDPCFAQKAADVIGLYLQPPDNAAVLAVDEKPHMQALERAQDWLRLPNGKALSVQPRLQAAWHHHVVCRPSGGHRARHRRSLAAQAAG